MTVPHKYKVDQYLEGNKFAMGAVQKLDRGIEPEKVKSDLEDIRTAISSDIARNFNYMSSKSEELTNYRKIEVAIAAVSKGFLLAGSRQDQKRFYEHVNNAIEGQTATGQLTASAIEFRKMHHREAQADQPKERVTISASHKPLGR